MDRHTGKHTHLETEKYQVMVQQTTQAACKRYQHVISSLLSQKTSDKNLKYLELFLFSSIWNMAQRKRQTMNGMLYSRTNIFYEFLTAIIL
jgi:hypothetical protein